MKLATTTGDFSKYTLNQFDAMECCVKARFRYLDYDFGADFRRNNGIASLFLRVYTDRIISG